MIEDKIEQLREQLNHAVANIESMPKEDILQLSEQLDSLIAEYYEITRKVE